jgi:rhamnopyranosyl-N-acetylglucosaminyl-diphospho-decaprenol beta-1,3/1,4-galactofuranosyltransferase
MKIKSLLSVLEEKYSDMNNLVASQRRSPLAHASSTLSQPGTCIWVVVVAYQRDEELSRLLVKLQEQYLSISGVVVVDNASQTSTAQLSAAHGVHYIGSKRNLGGAGGFSLGIMTALARGADYVWLWDDDGFPENQFCLHELYSAARNYKADLVAPLVVSDADPQRAAFAFRLNGKRVMRRDDIQQFKVIQSFVHLFNGALLRADCFERYGLPDYRYFIRGDEVDFMFRLVRAGATVLTYTGAVARHPSGEGEVKAVPGLPFGVNVPHCETRREITFRNRAQNFLRHRKWILALSDHLRYGIYFLARSKPDFDGYRRWLSATMQGYRGHIGRQHAGPDSKEQKNS